MKISKLTGSHSICTLCGGSGMSDHLRANRGETTCGNCDGKGTTPDAEWVNKACQVCGGKGKITDYSKWATLVG